MQLHFETYGSGRPLVILHGLFGSLENWRGISRELASQFQVIAVDQRNHGRSPHADDMNYESLAGDVLELLSAFGFSSAHVLGHSMGGKTAMQIALNSPEMVGKLIVVDMAPRAFAPRHRHILSALLALNPAAHSTRTEMEQDLAEKIPDLSLRRFLLKNLQRDEKGVLGWRMGLNEISKNYESLNGAVSGRSSFQHPTLFIRGETSDYLTEADVKSAQQLFPSAKLATVSRAGHLVHTENPLEFLEIVRDFLADA